jgi:cytochrome c oxidase subunit 1
VAVKKYGSLKVALGINVFSKNKENKLIPPPYNILAGIVVATAGLTACVVDAVIVTLLIINLVDPAFVLNPLFAKNTTYYTAHTRANVQICFGAGIAYAVLPLYTKRKWYTSRAIVVGWLFTLAFVMLAFFHHMYQDFVQPLASQFIGNIASYSSPVPAVVVTVFGALLF